MMICRKCSGTGKISLNTPGYTKPCLECDGKGSFFNNIKAKDEYDYKTHWNMVYMAIAIAGLVLTISGLILLFFNNQLQ